MEVVLTDGSVVSTNKVKRPDLFKALKGGSNNFGVVTRFDLMTYPQGQLYGGFLTYPASTIPRQLTAFAQFMEASKSDPHAEIICAIGYVGAYQSVVVSLRLHYTKAVENPAIFEPCKQIRPQLKNTMRLTSNFDLVNEAETNQAKNARSVETRTAILKVYTTDQWLICRSGVFMSIPYSVRQLQLLKRSTGFGAQRLIP